MISRDGQIDQKADRRKLTEGGRDRNKEIGKRD